MSVYSKKIKYFAQYLLLVLLLKFLRLLGLNRSAELCSFIAVKIGSLFKVNQVAHKNLIRVFGKGHKVDKILINVWSNFGRFIGEFPYLYFMSKSELSQRVKIEGIENIEDMRSQKTPFLVYSGHFANWEFVLKILDMLYPNFAVAYRKANNPYVDSMLKALRMRANIIPIEKGTKGSRALLSALKAKYSIAMLVDQKMNDGIEVPFFGFPAMTANAIAKLSIRLEYPIVPLQIIRTEGSNFRIRIYPPIKIEKSGEIESDCYKIMLQINQTLEQWILEHPDQWFWFHNRWSK
jgi:KDO2-lipid IV(A) lauroyltransferase